MQSILKKCGRISIEDGQCHEDFISCNRSWRFCFTSQPSINLCSPSFQGKLSNVNSLQSSFSATTTLDHHIEKLTVLKQCLVNQRGLKSILITLENSSSQTSNSSSFHVTKLSDKYLADYVPRRGIKSSRSSTDFFFDDFFFDDLFFFFF